MLLMRHDCGNDKLSGEKLIKKRQYRLEKTRLIEQKTTETSEIVAKVVLFKQVEKYHLLMLKNESIVLLIGWSFIENA